MKKRVAAALVSFILTGALLAGCGGAGASQKDEAAQTEAAAQTEVAAQADDASQADSTGTSQADSTAQTDGAGKTDEELAAECAALIDAIYVQERTETTDEDIAAARAAWDALTDEQKAMVEGEFADPDYFGLDTGDASADDPLNADGIGENELLVVAGSKKRCRRPIPTGPCAEPSRPRSSSIISRPATTKSSTTWNRHLRARRLTA